MKLQDKIKIIEKGLRDLRYGIFSSPESVNELLDKLIALCEEKNFKRGY